MNNSHGKILVVDDNITILQSLKQLLKHDFAIVNTISNPDLLFSTLEKNDYDVILLDMNFKAGARSGEEGLLWTRKILDFDADAIIILITAYGDIELAVKAIRAGGIDFIMKPWEPQKLISTLKSAVNYKKAKLKVKELKTKQSLVVRDIEQEFGQIITGAENMDHVLNTVDKVAKTDANILITGEHGTGKELIAREIHRKSTRNEESFIKVDLGSIPESLFESEMFGHAKGAFTDALEERTGRIEIASGGTLFLDEIANLSLGLQAKLLSTLQNRNILKIGTNKEIPVNIRLVCASNQNLAELVANNMFREDLLYRINTIRIHLPPLRDRENDIILLADHFINHFSKKYNKKLFTLSKEAAKKLLAYHWPGNIRELKHTIEKAVILSDSRQLVPEVFQLSDLHEKPITTNLLRLSDLEKETIKKVLKIAHGNITEAAKILDISRTTLYSKMEKHGL